VCVRVCVCGGVVVMDGVKFFFRGAGRKKVLAGWWLKKRTPLA